jgi:hypothetical protein
MMCLALNLLSKREGEVISNFLTLWEKGRHRHTEFDRGFLDIAGMKQVASLMHRTFPYEALGRV